MTLLISALSMGLILSLLAIGVLISFRILSFRDLTVDGSLALGGAIAATLIVQNVPASVATLIAMGCGGVAGLVTGMLATQLRINPLLAGILVMTALYSVNLRVMGKSNLPLLDQTTLFSTHPAVGAGDDRMAIGPWQVATQDLRVLGLVTLLIAAAGAAVAALFRTQFGLALRATGDNPEMMRAQGVDVRWMVTLGLALANALVAASGALLVQYQGFADVQMGIGMVVWGLASVIIGETLVRSRLVGLLIAGAVMGSVLFRQLVAIALRWGLNPNDLKLVTALFVLAALVFPDLLSAVQRRMRRGASETPLT